MLTYLYTAPANKKEAKCFNTSDLTIAFYDRDAFASSIVLSKFSKLNFSLNFAEWKSSERISSLKIDQMLPLQIAHKLSSFGSVDVKLLAGTFEGLTVAAGVLTDSIHSIYAL